jgi:hypothetical protein
MLIEIMGSLHDFAKVKCPCGAMWRGIMVPPIAYMDSTRRKKGFFFFVNEDAHLCCSLRDSQDLITNNNKENNGFLGSSF